MHARISRWRLTCEHGEEPGDGVQLGHEAGPREVLAEPRVDEGGQQAEHRQVLLDHRRVLLQEEVVQVLGNERRQTSVRQRCTGDDKSVSREGRFTKSLPPAFWEAPINSNTYESFRHKWNTWKVLFKIKSKVCRKFTPSLLEKTTKNIGNNFDKGGFTLADFARDVCDIPPQFPRHSAKPGHANFVACDRYEANVAETERRAAQYAT